MDWSEVEARVREDEQRGLEAFMEGKEAAPTMYRPITFKAEKEGGDSGLMRFIASTEDKDRAGDVIRQNWELGNFKANPVYMWGHDYSRAPIGTVPRIWVENQKATTGGPALMNLVRFDESDSFAMDIKGKFERGVLKAQSVGFRPLEANIMRDEDGHFDGYEFTKSELLEISAVSIPMNQMALRKAYELAEKAPVVFWMQPDVTINAPTKGVTLDELKDILDKRDAEIEEKFADIPEPPVVEEPELDSEPATEISAEQSAELVNALRTVKQEEN
jgi:HK97 family phage prohead protease